MALIFLESDAPGKTPPATTTGDWLAGLALVVWLVLLFGVLPLLVDAR